MAVRETVEHAMERCGKKEYPITITRRVGLHTFVAPDGKEVLVDFVTIVDAGKYGTSVCYTPHRDYTPEQRAAGRKNIQDTIRRVMDEQGLW